MVRRTTATKTARGAPVETAPTSALYDGIQRLPIAASGPTIVAAPIESSPSLLRQPASALVQRFTEEDVKKRAYEIWQKKGSPPNQSKEEQDKDYLEARRQLEVEERAHGIWEGKGSPQGQSEEQRKRDYSEAEFQLDTLRKLNAIADLAALSLELTKMRRKGFGWSTFRFIFKSLDDGVRTQVRTNSVPRKAAFQLCTTGADKGELLYLLGGDANWKRATMAENGISHDNMREGLVRLGVFETGTAGHKKGEEVDQLIQTHLRTYVESNLNARGKIKGRIAVVGAEDWDVIGRHEYGTATWDGGKKNTLNAFVDRSSDPPRVFVNKDRGNAGTAIHEACHMWGDSGRPIDAISHALNEGVTEYFARKVCSALTPPIPRTVYAREFAVANQLVSVIGEDKVAAAFFDGNVAAIEGEFSPAQWTVFIAVVNGGAWGPASTVLSRVERDRAGGGAQVEQGALKGLFGDDD